MTEIKTYSEEEKRQIIADVENNDSGNKAKAITGHKISTATYYTWRRELGLIPDKDGRQNNGGTRPGSGRKKQYKTYTEEEKRAIVEEIEKAPPGTKTAMMKAKGVNTPVYYAWRLKFKKQRQAVGTAAQVRYGPEKRAELLRDYEASGAVSQSEYGRRIGLSPSAMSTQLRQARKERNGAGEQQQRVKKNQPAPDPAGEALFCPCCGVNILAEFAKLTMKLKAMQSINL